MKYNEIGRNEVQTICGWVISLNKIIIIIIIIIIIMKCELLFKIRKLKLKNYIKLKWVLYKLSWNKILVIILNKWSNNLNWWNYYKLRRGCLKTKRHSAKERLFL